MLEFAVFICFLLLCLDLVNSVYMELIKCTQYELMAVIFKENVKWRQVLFFQCEIPLPHTSGDLEFFCLITEMGTKS